MGATKIKKIGDNETRVLSLEDCFGPAIIHFSDVTVNISTDGHGRVKVETGGVTVNIADGQVTSCTEEGSKIRVLQAKTHHKPDGANSSAVISSHVNKKSFSLDNGVIRAGKIEINKISPYMRLLPDTATATLLVSPEELADIDGDGLGTWNDSIRRIGDIKDYHGLDGIPLLDRHKTAKHLSYERKLAFSLADTFLRAYSSQKPVVTGWFMPTKSILDGCYPNSGDIILKNNLYAKQEEIAKKGDFFVSKTGSALSHWWLSATENPNEYNEAYFVDFTDRNGGWVYKDQFALPVCPVALIIHP